MAGAGTDLRNLVGGVEGVRVAEVPDIGVSGLSYASGSVSRGDLFFCVPGFRADGHDFAADAVARGAAALVCERRLDVPVPQVVVADVRAAMAPVAARFYGDPSAELEVVGVTGTNGKTTIACLARALEEAAGRSCGLLGTVHSVVAGNVEPVERTTPEAPDLQRALRRMVDGGDRACAMEVSSHATQLHRADAIRFDCAIFTNLSQDHLDFHGTLERYFEAKRRLFFPSSGDPPRLAVVNVDDRYGRRLAADLAAAGRPPITYGTGGAAGYRAEGVTVSAEGSRLDVVEPGGARLALDSPLVGRFNVANVLAAAAAALELGIDRGTVRRAVAAAGQVPGRFERVDEGQPFGVIVDYAHTPDSLASALRAARDLTPAGARVRLVFGCGGDRDRGKRPLMGEIAVRLADAVVVTTDNPRSEEPRAIVDEILAGVRHGDRRRPAVEVDRGAAIAAAICGAGPGDTVVIAGKGHEQGQELAGGRTIPFDDRNVARAVLRGLATPAPP